MSELFELSRIISKKYMQLTDALEKTAILQKCLIKH